MLFSLLEAQVKDSIPNASPKGILRSAKRTLRQINSIISGELKTDIALVEVINTSTTLTFSVADSVYTIAYSGVPNGQIFEGASVGDEIHPSGTLYNDKTFTIKTVSSPTSVIVNEVVVAEVEIACTIIMWTPATGYSLDFPELTLPSSLIKLLMNGVLVDDENWDARTRDYIKRNPTEESYHIVARDKILFAATSLLTSVDVAIQGYFGITLPASADISTDIAIPATWEEAFTAGVIAYLTLEKAYKDAELHSVNQGIFDRMLTAIRAQEKERFTASAVDQEYDYSKPEGK